VAEHPTTVRPVCMSPALKKKVKEKWKYQSKTMQPSLLMQLLYVKRNKAYLEKSVLIFLFCAGDKVKLKQKSINK
jgi:hypothetical protein